MAYVAHFGGKCIDAGCVDGLRIPVKMVVIHLKQAPHYTRLVDNSLKRNSKILITGGAGYVGSAIHEALKADFHVDICDLLFGSEIDFSVYPIQAYDVIIHLAAHSSVQMCEAAPNEAWKNNVVSFGKLLYRLRPDQLLITASSAAVYGVTVGSADESHEIAIPIKLYDTTKMINDLMVETEIARGKRIISLRFGTIAGPSPLIRKDTVVNAMCQDALKYHRVKAVNPEIRRAVLFLPDLINAVKLILRSLESNASGIYNLASLNTDIGSLGHKIAETVGGVEIEMLNGPSSNYDFHIDSSKFCKEFGEFKTTSLESVVRDLVNRFEGEN